MSLEIGNTTLRANNREGHAVTTGNYISPEWQLFLPYPSGDWYLRQTFVPAVGENETIVCHSLIEGLLPYYRNIGLIPQSASIIEVEPTLDGQVRYGFPFTDPLEILRNQVEFSGNGTESTLVSTFTGSGIDTQAADLRLARLNPAPSNESNNKSRLRQASEKYGFSMLPGQILQTQDDIEMAVNSDWNTDHGVWLKFPTGSGGDLVYRIPHKASERNIEEGVDSLREAIRKSFSEASFGISFNSLWPLGSFIPAGFPLSIEADAKLFGEIVVNGSTQFITNSDETIDMIGHFSQITSETGEYLGNEPLHPDSNQRRLIEEQINNVARYNIHENRYFGIQGVDWFLTRDQDGELMVTVTELNSRPTANTPPVIIAEKLGASHWINTNMYTNTPINSIDDYINIVGMYNAYSTPEKGMIIPQAFRTFVSRKETIASSNFKALILGRDAQHCRKIMENLNRGISFNPGK